MKISAVIFDLDGTVVADEDEYGEAFRRILKKLGVVVRKKYPHVGGIGVKENWPIFIKKYKIKTDKSLEELTVLTQEEYKKLIPRVTLKEGLLEFINNLKKAGLKVALATSNSWDVVEKLFDHLGIEKYFDSVTTGEEVVFKKPDPDLFLKAAEKMGVEPSECIVFEDSETGIRAAHKAGMIAIGVYRDKIHKKSLKSADFLIANFKKINSSELAAF